MFSFIFRFPLAVIEPISGIDWDTLKIDEIHDDEGRLQMPSEQQVYMSFWG